ncbi:protein CDV3 homolog isoform X2 [Varanus komodoensis]|uniref:protein CDV3 homolog isoform X2 n=1 Tax=Varanus komodoensis TaxID=61221 RepID=UPI001CF7AEEE|nr:protein CDV3 homolog isoform X2 [Varanus komodoensis]
MAETEERSLDDFFAKRDKKKRKEKSSRGGATAAASSAASSNAAAASGTGGSRQAETGSGAASHSNATAKVAYKEEDDWKEFEQEEIVDYSGLRVQSMQISEKDDDEGEKKEEPSDNSEEPGGCVDKVSGPWNKSAPTQQTTVVETVESPEPVQSSGVYRPPGAREGRTRKVPQGPPEIYSDTQFPSLQSTAKHVDTRKDKEMEKSFEVVKHKTRGRDEVSKTQATKLQLDNQYAVLGDQ